MRRSLRTIQEADVKGYETVEKVKLLLIINLLSHLILKLKSFKPVLLTKTSSEPTSIMKPKPSIDEVLLQFESEVNDHLRTLTQLCINYVNPVESDAIQIDFRRWVNSHFR
ncbi:unnamed protein product [Vicia faba]|uniref:Uncharacterized protein n=1 Tax=Vicia faba TaxID=3906 RepID=A0AAV0ZYS3_VICFA|nr:unnamed protein product [Vicia faba]